MVPSASRPCIRFLILLVVFVGSVVPISRAIAEEVEPEKDGTAGVIDVNRLELAGLAWLSGTPSDIGDIRNVFDRDISTLYRSANINPAFIQVAFSRPGSFHEFRTHFSHHLRTYRWRVETAESQADLNSRSGSYVEAVGWTETESDRWSVVTLPRPVAGRVVRLTVERVAGDNFVHIDEWEMFGRLRVDLLREPRGLDIDSRGRTFVVESGADRIVLFRKDGRRLRAFGSSGSGRAQFRRPWDVTVDGDGRVFVADRGNHRIQVFNLRSFFVRQFGGRGSEPGQLIEPQGIAMDRTTHRIYVADTGNHRVQRFRPDGSLDRRWGDEGVVGATGAVKRDHTGFDGPTDVAVNPRTGNVYIADRGNHRVEVFDASGAYVRSYLAVYRPNSLAFGRHGNLYIAGEDPNEAYKAFDGRLRLLKRGDELISRHYTGGLDDVGRIGGGVASHRDGTIVFSDVIRGRLVKTNPAFSVPVRNLEIEDQGTTVTFRWKTAQSARGTVRLGSSPFEDEVIATDRRIATRHQVTFSGLTPNTRLYYAISFSDPFDGTQRFTRPSLINTGSVSGGSQFLRLKVAGVIYTDVHPGPGYVGMDASELAEVRTRFQRIADFYWRNSRFRLWPDIQLVEVDRDVTGPLDFFSAAEADLGSLGYGGQDDFDAAWGASPLGVGNFGAGGSLFGRFVGLAQWVTQADFPAIHEVNHSIDSIYAFSGLRDYEFNHGLWAVPHGVGHEFAINAQIPRNMLPASLTAAAPPFAKILTAPDADDDSVPDSSPGGLTESLSITEATLGSSTSSSDTDGDGLSDLNEATALPFHNTDLNAPDTDEDGQTDGSDPNPAYRMNDRIAKGTPVIDGVIRPAEPWTILTDRWGYSNDALVSDSNSLQGRVTTYGAWDDRFLYLALRGPEATAQVYIDGGADGRFFGPDSYWLSASSAFFFRGVKVNVGVPDLFRQIDDDGQFSEFFDTDPQFTKPYMGRPFFDKSDEGAGFPGRLVTEEELEYGRGGSGRRSVWELAIPWSRATLLRGFDGKEMAIGLDVGGDLLFETDHNARIRLVATPERFGRQV